MIAKLLDRLLPKRVIVNCERDPYLHRWFLIRLPWFGVFIHKFVRSDEDRALHDHPWSFIVIPLWGGYIEHSERRIRELRITDAFPLRESYVDEKGVRRAVPLDPDAMAPVRRRVRPLISTRYRPAEYRHRVELIDGRPSWSLFIRFRKRREWGFWEKTGFVQWNNWWNEKCE